MGVPKNVLEQEAEADRAIEEAQKQRDANPSQPVEHVQTLDANGNHAAETTQQEPAEFVASPVIPEGLQEQLDRERHLRKTLEGRLKSQLKPANEENRRLRAELEATTEEIRKLRLKDAKPGVERYLNDEERRELGDGVVDLNARMIKGILEEELEKNGVAGVVDRIMKQSSEAKDVAETQEPAEVSADFWPIVDQYCPGARKINSDADERWVEYLGCYHTVTGRKNRDMAQEAMDDDDPSALADIFSDFMRKYGIESGAGAPTETVRSNRPIKPERGGEREIASTGAKRRVEPWTKAEVNAFYTDISKGKFKGREAERDKLEAELMEAVNAGLVTG